MFSAKHNLIAGGYLADSEGGGGLVEGVDPDQAVLGGGAGQQHQQRGQHGNTETKYIQDTSILPNTSSSK